MSRIGFNINYFTHPGQSVALIMGKDGAAEVIMTSTDGTNWRTEIDVPEGEEVVYRYKIKGGGSRAEWGESRSLRAPAQGSFLEIIDRWRDRPEDSPLYSKAFGECVFRRKDWGEAQPSPGSLTLTINAPGVSPGQSLHISGNCAELGNWNPAEAAPMTPGRFPQWHFTLKAPADHLEFKFLVRDERGMMHWEDARNREFEPAGFGENRAIINDCGEFTSPLPLWRGAGTAIPVFSLRSGEDWGIGDFPDICLMADWVSAAGQKFLQLLPVNDTTATRDWPDSYPYNAISSFALNPIYLRPDEMGILDNPEQMADYRRRASALNELPELDYARVAALKEEYMRQLFAEKGEKTIESEEFKDYVRRNSGWLEPYAAFCVLRDRFGTTDMTSWGEFSNYSEEMAGALLAEEKSGADFYRWQQYHADAQLRRARTHCHEAGVALKGDIPIGVSRCSVDAWVHPELFNLDMSAGAPPDAFAIDGQNWGFPTYNWPKMAEDGYGWWKGRLKKMADYFDAYRIDHLLGFFRIWQIPMSAVHGLLGSFSPALPFSAEELERDSGFIFDRRLHAEPYITEELLWRLFGEETRTVKEGFLESTGQGRWRLRPEFDTQKKIAAGFPAGAAETAGGNRVYNGLLRLAEEVLFIEDAAEKGRWHPRIGGDTTAAFGALSPEQQERYRELHHHFFYERNDSFWRGKALEKLPPLIDSTGMLCCAEDLGMIPACVPGVMDSLHMLSLKVQRMPDDPGREFADTRSYPYYSVATTSTHDMGGIRQWWEENPRRTQRCYNQALGLTGNAPYYAEPWICDRIVSDHLSSPAMLCILPLQDWLATDGRLRRDDPRREQINDPANPANRWNYRMHLTLESLLGEEEFTRYLRRKTEACGR